MHKRLRGRSQLPRFPQSIPQLTLMPSGGGMSNMSGNGGGMMSLIGMMDMGGGGNMAAMPQSALPGFPGASHLYHLGATGFFLDHPQHIALTTEQRAGLNQAKEQALLVPDPR